MVRIKQRYILGELVLDADLKNRQINLNHLTQKRLTESFRAAVLDLYGEFGLAMLQPNFVIKFWNVTTKVFILRVGRENCDQALASLNMMTALVQPGETITYHNGADLQNADSLCRVRILHIGGTLDKVEQHYKAMSEAWLQTTFKKQEKMYAGNEQNNKQEEGKKYVKDFD